MAHKKAGGSTDNGRDSNAKRRGVKLFGGQSAAPGNIIVRQKGTKWFPGEGVQMGRDFTIFATTEGTVTFTKKRQKKFNGQTHYNTVVNVFEATKPTAKKTAPKAKAVKKEEEKTETITEKTPEEVAA